MEKLWRRAVAAEKWLTSDDWIKLGNKAIANTIAAIGVVLIWPVVIAVHLFYAYWAFWGVVALLRIIIAAVNGRPLFQ